MIDNVIYFPYINLPNNKWLNQITLYWDKIYTINSKRQKLQKHMVNLEDENLVKILNFPLDKDYPLDNNNFLDLIDKSNYLSQYSDPSKWQESIRLFHNKFDSNESIVKGLIERGFAKDTWNGDYEVEANIAKLYMNYLVDVIGSDREINAMPITDDGNVNSYFEPSSNYYLSNEILNEIRYPILENILPTPEKFIPATEIAKFKNDNYDILTDFRKSIEKEIIILSKMGKSEDREFHREEFINDAQNEIDELTKLMQANNWKNVICSNWKSIGATGFLSLIELAQSNSTNFFPITLIANLIMEGKQLRDEKNKEDLRLRNNVYAYAVIRNEKFKNY